VSGDVDSEGDEAQTGEGRAPEPVGYLVFFARDPVDDALADEILARVRARPGVGWFDDPGAESPAERTTGGYMRVGDPDEPAGRALVETARAVSSELGLTVELQWREEAIGHCERGTWRAPGPSS
jgi:hypothetical protein